MQAWRVHELGEPEQVMRLDEVDEPVPGPGQLLVRVEATALNFPDALLCRGLYQQRPPLPFTPGLELAGEVAAVGPDVQAWQVGDRVLGTPEIPLGGLADYTLVGTAGAFPVPEQLDAAEAAALHIAYQTGWFALHRRAGLRSGETLLVHAGAGGVGSAAIQLGKAAGARVIAVAGGADKAKACRELGADVVVDRLEEDFVAAVKDATGGRGADVVFDPVGGDAYDRSTKCVAFEGRILVIGFASGRIQQAAASHVLVKNYGVLGVHWGLYRTYAPELVTACHEELTRLVADGTVRPFVSERLPLAAAADGVARLAAGRTVGRLVVQPSL
jgi:NADPH:quinone reductase